MLLLLAAVEWGGAQNVVESGKVVEARALRGSVVLLNSRDPVDDVLVEDCTSDWKTVTQSTHTDPQGHFAFHHGGRGAHFLRFSAAGLQTVKVRVHVLPLSPKSEVRIEMPVAM